MLKSSSKKSAARSTEKEIQAAAKPVRKRDHKKQSLILLSFTILVIILVNLIGAKVFTRFDLTAEKRYTLSPSTRALLDDVNDYIFFRVYLDGEFPAEFKRLRNETREMLNQFRAYNKFITYEFIDPNSLPEKSDRDQLFKSLIAKGINPFEVEINESGSQTKQYVFPGAVVSYNGDETGMPIMLNQIGQSPDIILNNSIQNLEYNLASTIKKLIDGKKPTVAFLGGYGQLEDAQIYSAVQSLSDRYAMQRVKIDGKVSALTERITDSTGNTSIFNKFKAIVIARPDSAFTEKDKFIIDQFIMRGGKVLWLVDGAFAEMDSLRASNQTIAIPNEVNLDDMLFTYGARINKDLLLDVRCLPITMVTGMLGNQPQFNLVPWLYFPLIAPSVSEHPITRNINALKTQFISTIDTIAVKGVKKTILLTGSQYSHVVAVPQIIDLNMAKEKPDPGLFTKSYLPTAVLLEGTFRSLYTNRVPPEISLDKSIGFKDNSKKTSMIIVSDGDVIRNQFSRKSGKPLPLGFDQDVNQTFGNKEFLLNAMDYLLDDSRLIDLRSREIKIRPLDRQKIEADGLKWQIINVVLPVFLVIIAGVTIHFLRKRKYGKR